MKLAADIADSVDQGPFDVHVDVFEFLAELEPASGNVAADLFETGDNLVPLLVGEDAHFGEHVGVDDRAADIVGIEAAIEAHAFGELLDAAVGRPIENSAPRLIGQDVFQPKSGRRSAEVARRKKYSNMFILNVLRRGVNERRAADAQ